MRSQVANRSDFAVIPVEGFNPIKVRDFTQGMKTTLGGDVLAGVIFDRDYRSNNECKKELSALKKYTVFAHIHDRKELENFLLIPSPLKRAIEYRLKERRRRTGENTEFNEDVASLLENITSPLRHKIEAKYLGRRRMFEKSINPSLDDSTIDEQLMTEFEERWTDPEERYLLVPGKDILSALNSHLQAKFNITISAALIISCFRKEEIPKEMIDLIEEIDGFRRQPIE